MKSSNKIFPSSFLKKFFILIVVLSIIVQSSLISFATTYKDVQPVLTDTATYINKTVKSAKVGSIGGEWAIIGLSRSSQKISNDYYNSYYKNLEKYVKEKKGVLHDVKYTEYSRVILAVSSLGKDAANVAGYNLVKPLSDFDKSSWQGINGSIFALIALDSKNYSIDKNTNAKTVASRDIYIKDILSKQLKDGGWSFSGDISDPDITAMALQALAKYKSKPEVKKSINLALDFLSKAQNNDGGFTSWGNVSSESTSQVIIALSELGISVDDKRFVKNKNTLLTHLLSYYKKGFGFKHISSEKTSNAMATEQAMLALVSLERFYNKSNSLYNMSDAKIIK